MIVNNGERLPLTIREIAFSGLCGRSRGLIAFVPPVPIVGLKASYSAILDGRPVVLANVKVDDLGPGYTAQVLG